MFLKRIFCTVAVCLALVLSAAAASKPLYTLTVDQGYVCIRELTSGTWVFRSQIPAESLSDRDQLLLRAGIFLYDRADFTRAVEDFCS